MDVIIFLSSVFCAFLPLTTIFALTPYISRKGTCFGVMLMEDAHNSEKIKKLKREYSFAAIACGIFFAAASIIALSYNAFILSLIAYCIVGLGLYIACSSAMRNLIMSEDWENLQKQICTSYIPDSNSKGAISIFWYAAHLPVIAYCWYISLWSGVGYSLFIPIAQTVIFAVMIFIHLLIKRCSHYANKNNYEASIKENMRMRRRWSIFIFFAGIFIQLLLLFIQFGLLGKIANSFLLTAAPFIFTIAMTAATVIFAVKNSK